MNCDRCWCNSRAVAKLPNDSAFYKNVDINCTAIKLTRTATADYYWCHKGGPPNDPSPGGWYSGRGY